jgi:proteasome lid subunit RPN8/RPN11
MILLDEKTIRDIRQHGEAEYPQECCGMLLGRLLSDRTKKIEECLLLSNARENSARHNRFLITPVEFMKCDRIARSKQLDILGIYHSHPDHPAAPSDYDREHAFPFYSYVIVSVANGKAEELTSWELEEDRSGFSAERILWGE